MIEQTSTAILNDQRHYRIAVDGSCKPNPGTGGWGALIQLCAGETMLRQRALAGQGEVMISTCKRMELQAAIQGLQSLSEPLPVIVTTASEYVIKGMTERVETWKANDWHNSDGPVRNYQLWEQLYQASLDRSIKWVWQRSNVGHYQSEIADHLARHAAKGLYPQVGSVKKRHPDWFW